MKVIHLLPHIRNTGNGITNAAVDLAVAQVDLGIDVTVASLRGEYLGEISARGVRFREIDITGWKRFSRFLCGMRQVRQLVRENRSSIFHCHTLTALLISFLCGARRRVVTVHNSWQRFTFLNAWFASRVIVLSDVDLARFVKFSPKNIPARIQKIENGVVHSFRYDSEPASMPLARPAVVTVAGLYKRKGIQDLLDAFSRMEADANLYVVGEGPYRQELEKQVARLGLNERVFFVGFSAKVRDYMSSCDLFVLASHSEPAGLVLLEARMSGAPILASNVGGIPSMLKPAAGLAFRPHDPDGLSRLLDDILLSPSALEDLRQRSLDGLEYYSTSRVAAEVLSVYSAIYKRPGGR